MAQELDVFACPLDRISLIEASAGTGKTWNICALYLRLLLEQDVPANGILVVTFTNSATAELAERIRQRLGDVLRWLRSGREEADHFPSRLIDSLRARRSDLDLAQVETRLDDALAAFDEAAIFTIHGFCQRALADTAFSAGEPFTQDIAADDDALLHELAADFWRERIAAATPPAGLLQELLHRGDTPERWGLLLRRILAKPLAQRRWPASAPQALEAAWHTLERAYTEAWQAWQCNGTPAPQILAHLPHLDGRYYKADRITETAAQWADILARRLPLPPDDAERKRLALFSTPRLSAKRGHPAVPPHPFFSAAEALLEASEHYTEVARSARAQLLRQLIDYAEERLEARKRTRRVLVFDDLLKRLWDALEHPDHPWLAQALRERFPAALIDEFQDTDPLQFAIFHRLYGDAGRLFLVGDPKQAIYRFRNADLHTYLRAREHAAARYTLRHNQRSVAPLIKACNALFSGNPQLFLLPGLDYTPVEAGDKPRQPLHDDSGGDTRALQLWRLPGSEEADQALDRTRALNAVATACAGEIARLLRASADGQLALGDSPLQPRHIAVLVRTHREAQRIKRALAEFRVGAVELSQSSVYSSREAQELAQVLQAILEPGRRAQLFAALATTLMGHDALALETLAQDDHALLALMQQFDELRQRWSQRGIAFALRAWQRDFGVSARLLAQAQGERALTNLLHLFELLQQAAGEHPQAPALLRWFGQQRSDSAKQEEAQLRLESDQNLVPIVTIHRAKGLEFPVVFCPYLFDSREHRAGMDEFVEYHEGETLVIDFRGPDAAPQAEAQHAHEDAAEELRLIYVALTRAVHRCYLTSGLFATQQGGRRSLRRARNGLLNWMVSGQHSTGLAAWLEEKRSPGQLAAAWDQLVATHPDCISLTTLPTADAALSLAREQPPSLRALEPPPRLPEGWRIGSFTSLMQGAQHTANGDDAADHDALPLSIDDAPTAPPELPSDDILAYPRGAEAGTTLHAVFEHADFDTPASWEPAVTLALQSCPLTGADELPVAAQLHSMLRDVLQTELWPGFRLSQLGATQRQCELGFTLPSAHLRAGSLNDFLRQHGYRVPPLSFAQLSGYLTGFIDLVFEQDGRFYLADWKSNHLGYQREDYLPAHLEDAMATHGYALQALLYSVALHRMLRQRLPAYAPATHLGGAYYLFVRGVRQHWQAPGAPCGILHLPADTARILALDALFDDG